MSTQRRSLETELLMRLTNAQRCLNATGVRWAMGAARWDKITKEIGATLARAERVAKKREIAQRRKEIERMPG